MSEKNEPTPESTELEPEPRRVLHVEDDEDMARLIGRTLTSMGLAVDHVPNGEQAILVTQNHLPTLVVMDLMMPRLDGFEATRYLKLRYTEYVPILIVSALDDAESQKRAREVGADFYLTKPVRAPELRDAVTRLLELAEAENAFADAPDGEPRRVVECRLALANRLCDSGLTPLARVHLARVSDLAPTDAEVVELGRRLGA